MTAGYIAFRAAERPDAVALVTRGGTITYAELSRDIDRLTRAVAGLGVPRGGSVAVGCGSVYTHWVLLLACERLGLAAASAVPGEAEAIAALLADVDLFLADPQFPDVSARRRHAITPEWLAHAGGPGVDGTELPRPRPEDPVRILRTSGTTGSAKRVLHTRALHDAWVMRWIVMTGLTRHSRLLLTMPFVVNGMYACATACLRAGGTVVSTDILLSSSTASAISGHAITASVMLPVQLERLLNDLPADFVKPPSLTLCTFGAAISDGLRRQTLERLATNLIDMYGSNEAGFIASRGGSREDGASAIWPGVRVEIVDDQDAPLPQGQPGRIRVKTPDMVRGYLGNPEATSRMFKNGWFYPGDLGILPGPGALRVLGRGDELMNLGGNKILPDAIERAILDALTLGDVGVCSAKNTVGVEELMIGMVGVPYDDGELLERLNGALAPFRVPGYHVIKLPQIPRTATGKIQRNILRRTMEGLSAPRGRS